MYQKDIHRNKHLGPSNSLEKEEQKQRYQELAIMHPVVNSYQTDDYTNRCLCPCHSLIEQIYSAGNI